jgi:hypothetical protein
MAESNMDKKEPVLASLPFAYLGDLKKGKVELTRDSLLVWSKKSLLKKPQIKMRLAADSIDSFTQDYHGLMVSLIMRNGAVQDIEFHDEEATRQFFDALKTHLGPLDEVSRSENERRQRELEESEKEKQRKKELREKYAAVLWKHVDGLRLTTAAIYRICGALRLEAWPLVEEQYRILWQQVEQLQANSGFTLTSDLNNIGKAFSESRGIEAAQACASFFELLTKSYLKNPPADLVSFEKDIQESVRPNWSHISFFHLFCALHQEVVLGSEVGDWASVGKSITALEKSDRIVSEIFQLKTGIYVKALKEAAGKKDLPYLKRTSADLEAFLAVSAQDHPFKEVNQNHGAMPSPA